MSLNRKQEQLIREMIREELNEISLSGAADWLKGRLGAGKKEKESLPKAANQLIKEFNQEVVKLVDVIRSSFLELKDESKKSKVSSNIDYALNEVVHNLNELVKKLAKPKKAAEDDSPNPQTRLRMMRLGRKDGETIVSNCMKSIEALKTKMKSWKSSKFDEDKSVFKTGGENDTGNDVASLIELKRLAQEGQIGLIKYEES